MNGHPDLVPDHALRIDGRDRTDDLRGHLVRIRAREDLHLLGWLELTLAGTVTPTEALGLLPPGSRIELILAHGGVEGSVFQGDVVAHSVEEDALRGRVLRVRALDLLHRLSRGERTRSFREVRHGDVVAEIAADRGLAADAERTPTVLPQVLQSGETDLDLLRRLAATVGFELFARDGRIVFRSIASGERPRRTIEKGRDLIEARLDFSIVGQPDAVEVRGRDPVDGTAIVGRAGAGDLGLAMGGDRSGPEWGREAAGEGTRQVVDEGVGSREEADARARAHLERAALEAVRAELVVIGDPGLRPGRLFGLAGMDDALDGDYYIIGAEHSVDPDLGYRTRLVARRNAAGLAPVVPPPATLPAGPSRGPAEPADEAEIRCFDPSGGPLARRRVLLRLPDGRVLVRVTDARGAVPWPEEAGEGPVDLELPDVDLAAMMEAP